MAELSPSNADELARRYEACVQAGSLGEALSLAQAILQDAPLRPAAHARLAQVLVLLGREAEAEAALQAALAKLRPHAGVLTQLGLLVQKRGEFLPAAALFARAAALEPANAAHRMREADCRMRGGDLPGAVAAQREAVRIAPNHKPFATALAALEAQLAEAPAPAAPAPEALAAQPARPSAPRPAGPQAKTALHGEDGYLFHEVDAAFPQICEGFGTDAELRRLYTLWEMRHGWCAARGITFRLLIVPEKHAIYADKLPKPWSLHPKRAAVRLMGWRDSVMRDVLHYPLEEIARGRATRDVCFRQDVHWTSYGAFLAYRKLFETLPEFAAELVEEADLSITTRRAVGDIALWLDMRTRETVEVALPPKVAMREIFSTKSFTTGQVDLYETDNPSGRRLVLFRTSNSTALMPYFARHFSRIAAVASTAMMADLIRTEQPHMVFCELPERYLAVPFGPPGPSGEAQKIKLPRDLEADVFTDMTGCTLPLPGAAAPLALG